MAKSKIEKKKLLNKDKLIYLFSTVLLVSAIYSISLFRNWLPFDENLFYKETIFPIPGYFGEVFEVIRTFVTNFHVESMNSLFSNYRTVRSNPLAGMLVVFTSYLFKTNVFPYHLLQVSIHLLNTILVWLIFFRITNILTDGNKNTFIYIIVSLFTGIWALHSASTEAVLLITNWDTILTYSFCLCFILFEISRNPLSNKGSTLKNLNISFLFCFSMFLTEYGYTLPLIVFFILFALIYKECGNLKETFSISFNKSAPYFTGLFFFILISLFKSDSPLNNLFQNQEHQATSALYIFIERNLWFVPQIFIHFLKLLFFPKTLSTYQSNLVHISNTLFNPYSVFCTFAYLFFLISPIIFFTLNKNKNHKFFIPLIYSFYFVIFPFLHILTPTYCLSADRYCYFPFFILMLTVLSILCAALPHITSSSYKIISMFFICILFIVSLRTIVRISEWNSLVTFYKSAIKVESNPLYKGHRKMVLANYIGELGEQDKLEEYLQESLKDLKKAIVRFKAAKKQTGNEPVTLQLYGLDYDSLILKSAYLITSIKLDNYRGDPKELLKFYKPFIKKNIKTAGPNQIELYADLLIKAGEYEKVDEVLSFAFNKFPDSLKILNIYSAYLLNNKKDLDKIFEVLRQAYKVYPNSPEVLENLFKYYEKKGDPIKEAEVAYLLGLREHSTNYYLKAAQLFLSLRRLPQAHNTLVKLARLSGDNPITFLLTSQYMELTGFKNRVLEFLNHAYIANKNLRDKKDANVSKSILLSLINVHLNQGDLNKAKEYLSEFEQIKNLTKEEKKLIENFKPKLSLK